MPGDLKNGAQIRHEEMLQVDNEIHLNCRDTCEVHLYIEWGCRYDTGSVSPGGCSAW